jgi:hypothetical protein
MTDPRENDDPRPPDPLPRYSTPGSPSGPEHTSEGDEQDDMDRADRANGEPDATDGGPVSDG